MNFGGNGTANHPKGKKHSEETRKRISIANKGKKRSEEARKRMSDSKKGKKRKKFSEETRKRMSIANMGHAVSAETRKRISEALKSAEPWNRKSVLMYDQSENFVMEFSSITSAAIYIGAKQQHVSAMLRGKCKSVKGYTFRYKNEKENPDR